MKYLRFGKVPENGRSINWLALTPGQREDLTGSENPAKDILTYKRFARSWSRVNLDEVFEAGVSCFRQEDGLPVVTTIAEAISLAARIDGHMGDLFQVTGEEVGIGTDGEPLVKVESSERIMYDKNELVFCLIEQLKNHFEEVSGEVELTSSDSLNHFFTDGEYYTYKGLTFRGQWN